MAIQQICRAEECSGCSACVNICPVSAIHMGTNYYGFMQPIIENEKCIECELCKKVCPSLTTSKAFKPLKTFAVINKNSKLLTSSSSGGCFSALASAILMRSGVVYGVALDREASGFICRHIRIDHLSELDKLQGSKYIQSNTENTFSEAKQDLENGKVVLYSGTPCQIAGLQNYLKKDYESLIVIDLICHGVPSLEFFNAYIRTLEKQIDTKVLDFSFRNKKQGWGLNYFFSFVYSDKNHVITKVDSCYRSSYYTLFLDSQIYRECCYQCKYAGEHRCGDLSIGDYWGIETEHPEILKHKNVDIKKGVSLLLVNTKKGCDFFELNKNCFHIFESHFEKAARWNKQLVSPSKRGNDRLLILDLFHNRGYKAVEEYYKKKYSLTILRNQIKRYIPNKVLCLISRLRNYIVNSTLT